MDKQYRKARGRQLINNGSYCCEQERDKSQNRIEKVKEKAFDQIEQSFENSLHSLQNLQRRLDGWAERRKWVEMDLKSAPVRHYFLRLSRAPIMRDSSDFFSFRVSSSLSLTTFSSSRTFLNEIS